MPDLIQFEEQLFAHDFERANFSSIFLLCQVDLTVSTLANLGQYLEVAMSKSGASLSKICPFTTGVFGPGGVVGFWVGSWRLRIAIFELDQAILTTVNITQQIVVMIKKVYVTPILALMSPMQRAIMHLQSWATLANLLTFGFCSFSKSSFDSRA